MSNDNTSESRPIIIRNTTDLQRLKLEKLMKHPDKPVIIPERPKERGIPIVPDFVRNVMGSSAGAGSGEFHVYRHLRRKEYARQKFMKEKGEREKLDNDYHNKLETNKITAAERTAKKRLKRLKRKGKLKGKKKRIVGQSSKVSESESSSSSSSEEQQEELQNKTFEDHSCQVTNEAQKLEQEVNITEQPQKNREEVQAMQEDLTAANVEEAE